MFDWQAELAPPAIPAVIVISGNSTAVAIVSDLTHSVSSAPIATHVPTAVVKPTVESLPLPFIRRDTLSISVSTTAYSRGLDYCKANLRGRLVLNKGDKPYATKDITAKLHQLWKTKGPWQMASLGRGAVGTPLTIDNVTRNRLYGHYARILVDLDLSRNIFYEAMVEWEGFAFPVAIEYEGLPDLCTHYHSIGHTINFCRRLHPRREKTMQPNDYEKQPTDKGKQPVHSQKSKQTWKPKDNPEGIGSSKDFATVETTQQEESMPVPDLLANANVVPTQQHVRRTKSPDLAVQHHEDSEVLAHATDVTIQNQEMPDDAISLATSRLVDKDINDVPFTIEVQTDVATVRNDRLPHNSTHVLEEITAAAYGDMQSVEHDDK
ncbi:hypothetical protein MTR_4g060870 [Medicago truncatula]|uniref:DUF4283 domain protein n=1 Tax=Medicago truncatula TaxID=3880 RepID=G7JQJ2_MEDTR|nr:hypothetical protein MTR_4g060870 [Medicago truncatula]